MQDAAQGGALVVSPWSVTRALLLVVGGLTLAGAAGVLAEHICGFDYAFGLIPLFDLNREHNAPSWYASATLLFAAFLLAVIASHGFRAKQRDAVCWGSLSVLFVFFSLDEALALHELWNEPLRGFGAGGLFYFAWLVPYLACLVLGAIAYAKFFFRLEPRTRNLVLLAAALYLGGAAGMEMISGDYFSKVGRMDAAFAVMGVIEELLEMLGIVVFLHALLLHIGSEGIRLQVGPDSARKRVPDRSVSGES